MEMMPDLDLAHALDYFKIDYTPYACPVQAVDTRGEMCRDQ